MLRNLFLKPHILILLILFFSSSLHGQEKEQTQTQEQEDDLLNQLLGQEEEEEEEQDDLLGDLFGETDEEEEDDGLTDANVTDFHLDFGDYIYPQQPDNTPRAFWLSILDVSVMTLLLLIGTWAFRTNKKRGFILILLVLSAGYLGFFRQGCICPVGAITNVSMAFVHPGYILSFFAVLYFFIPIVTAFFYGRTFCSTTCPLGAAQELLNSAVPRKKKKKKKRKPSLLEQRIFRVLAYGRYVILILVIYYAVAHKEYFACWIDPYIGLYRLTGDAWDWTYTGIGVGLALIMYRPYCRFFCPYGIILGLFSKLAFWKPHVDQELCKQCKLCGKKCRTDSIRDFQINPINCICCGDCYHACKKKAIK